MEKMAEILVDEAVDVEVVELGMVDPVKIIRVFVRRTRGTPEDGMSFIGDPGLFLPEAEEVHVSVAFSWDVEEAWRLVHAWSKFYRTVLIGGPALTGRVDLGDFEPGMYLKRGYVITTRGCPNRCWFCLVPDREGLLREMPIRDGFDVLDNNLLAASRGHIERVLDMLVRQKERARFTGGLEARRVEPWFAAALKEIRPAAGFLAYDRPGEEAAVRDAARLLLPCFTSRRLGCYVLCGYACDTLSAARGRCQFAAELGMVPFPMYYRGGDWSGRVPGDWRVFLRRNSRGVPDVPAKRVDGVSAG